MPTLADDLETAARRRAAAARFLPPGRERDSELRLAEMLDNAARRLSAQDAVAGLATVGSRAVAA